MLAGSVEFHPHAVHARDDDVIQTALEGIGVHIVLILPHANGLRIELHQFSQRIHQAPADAHRTAHRDVFTGKLLTGHLAGRINRGAALVDQNHRNAGWEVQRSDELLSLATGRAIADGDGLDREARDEIPNLFSRLGHLMGSAGGGINDVVVQQLALSIQHHRLATGPESRIESQHVLLTQRWS